MDFLVVEPYRHSVSPKQASNFPNSMVGRHDYMPPLVHVYFGLAIHLRFSGFHLTVDTLSLLVSHTDTTKTAWTDFHCCFCNLQGTHRTNPINRVYPNLSMISIYFFCYRIYPILKIIISCYKFYLTFLWLTLITTRVTRLKF